MLVVVEERHWQSLPLGKVVVVMAAMVLNLLRMEPMELEVVAVVVVADTAVLAS